MHRYFYRRIGGHYRRPSTEAVSPVKGILDGLLKNVYLGDIVDSSRIIDRMYDQTVWEHATSTLDTSLSGIIVGEIKQLEADILDHYKGDPTEETIRLLVASYMKGFGTKDDGGRVWRFLQLSSLLPRMKRRKLFPLSPSGNLGYVTLTEENLFRMIARGEKYVILNNVRFDEVDIKLRKGFFLYSLLSYNSASIADVNSATSPTKWRTKSGNLPKFVFLHQVAGINYGNASLLVLFPNQN